jgi:hypothetical protein
MSLKSLKFAEEIRDTQLPIHLSARARFMERLEEQIAMADAHLEGKEFARTVRRRKADPETGESKIGEFKRSVRPWWFKHATGLQYVQLRYGSVKLALNEAKPLIEAGRDLKEVKRVLQTVKTAAEGGEMDSLLVAAKTKRQPPKKKS